MLRGARIGFIGAGALAEALIAGLIGGGRLPAGNVMINDVREERMYALLERWGVRASPDKAEVLEHAEAVVLAVKPQDAVGALKQLANGLGAGKLLVSVAAGLPIAFCERVLGPHSAVVRAMPNTSCRVKESATALSPGSRVSAGQLELAKELFSSVGRVVVVPEECLDAVTALSGSGPAYFYLMIEALTWAAESEGLSRGLALELAIQTAYGAAAMLRETGETPDNLRKQVTSPRGTTEAGIRAMEEKGFSGAVMAGLRAAADRSRELGAELLRSERDGK